MSGYATRASLALSFAVRKTSSRGWAPSRPRTTQGRSGRWACGRKHLTDADVDRAFDEGAILRTHLMRPTWHFVAPADIRWILALTAPRVHAANAYMYRKLGLKDATFARSRKVLERALRGGKQLTRSELDAALRRAGIAADGLRLAYLMMHAELSGVICSGPRRGKQFTYALLDERAPGRGASSETTRSPS